MLQNVKERIAHAQPHPIDGTPAVGTPDASNA
jgi:hypothetical protein